MRKRLCTLFVALIVLANFSAFPAFAEETSAEPVDNLEAVAPFSYSNNFDDIADIAASTDSAAVAAATGLTFYDEYYGPSNKGLKYSIEDGVVKILTNQDATKAHNLSVYYEFPNNQTVTTGEISASVSLTNPGGSNNEHKISFPFIVYNKDGGKGSPLQLKGSVAAISFGKDSDGNSRFKANPQDKNGEYNLGITLARLSENEDWTVTYYDYNKTEGNQVLGSWALAKESYPSFSKIGFIQSFGMGTLSGYGATIDNVNVSYKAAEQSEIGYSNNFDDIADIAASTDSAAVAAATGLTFYDEYYGPSNQGLKYSIEDGVVKILTNQDATKAHNLSVYYEFPNNQTVKTGEISASFSFTNPGGNNNEHKISFPFIVYNKDGGKGSPLQLKGSVAAISFGKDSDGNSRFKANPQDKNGEYNLGITLARLSENEDWTVTYYDYNKTEGNQVLGSWTLAKETYPSFSKIGFFQSYGMGTLAGYGATIDNVNVKTTTFIEVVDGSETVGLGSDVEKFALTFSEPLPNPDDNVTLVDMTNENVEPITTKTIYNEETNKLEIMPDSLLNYGTTYNVVFEKGGVASYSFTTKAPDFNIISKSMSYSDGVTSLTEIPTSGTFSATYTVNTRADVQGKKLVIVLAAYNEAGVALKFDIATHDLTQGLEVPVSATITELVAGNVTNVKAFVWEYKDGIGYKPIK